MFTASTLSPVTGFPLTVQAANGVNVSFPAPNNSYNVRSVFNAQSPTPSPTALTGALTQGVMKIIPILSTTGGDISVYYTIQYRTTPSSDWGQAVDTGNNVINARQLIASNGNPGTETKNFSIVGEYRVISTNVGGEGCAGTGTKNFYVNFGDATYGTTDCTLGPR